MLALWQQAFDTLESDSLVSVSRESETRRFTLRFDPGPKLSFEVQSSSFALC